MKIAVPGLVYLSERDAGTFLQYSFSLRCDDLSAALRELLMGLRPGHELSFEDPGESECYLEVRRTERGFETKRGCHGSYGTWRPSTFDEAHAWLLPGARRCNNSAVSSGQLEFRASLEDEPENP